MSSSLFCNIKTFSYLSTKIKAMALIHKKFTYSHCQLASKAGMLIFIFSRTIIPPRSSGLCTWLHHSFLYSHIKPVW